MIRLPRTGVLAAAVLTASCGARLMRLPGGPGTPAGDGSEALAEATSICRGISSIQAEVAVSGSAGGRRLRARLHLGLQAPASARLEAIAPFGQPLFIFVARDNQATLLLPRDNRVLENGRPDAVLEALTGVPLDAAELRAALTGCSVGPDVSRAVQLADVWRVVPDGTSLLYLRRDPPAPWRLVATVHRPSASPEWRAQYSDFQDGLPRTVRFVSSDPDRFNLRLASSQVDLNMPLAAEAFEVRGSESADPISLDELRRSGPLGDEP
jgi:hypothetical protein